MSTLLNPDQLKGRFTLGGLDNNIFFPKKIREQSRHTVIPSNVIVDKSLELAQPTIIVIVNGFGVSLGHFTEHPSREQILALTK